MPNKIEALLITMEGTSPAFQSLWNPCGEATQVIGIDQRLNGCASNTMTNSDGTILSTEKALSTFLKN